MALPDFGMPARMPELPAELYVARVEQARERARARGYDVLIVYGDREHSANLSYLTGFDPRFEEALLIVGPDGDPALLAGNECVGMAKSAPLRMRVELHQDLSLTDQPRDRSRPIQTILREEGAEPGARIGVAGWKTYARRDWLETPAWLVDTLRALVGRDGRGTLVRDFTATPGTRVLEEAGRRWPLDWELRVPSARLTLSLAAIVPDQLVRGQILPTFWEGAATVTGTKRGVCFVEETSS